MRGRLGKSLDPLPHTTYERERRPQLRGHIGAQLEGDLVQARNLSSGQAENGCRVGAAAAEPGGDRDALLDLNPQRRAPPATLAQRGERPRDQILPLNFRADDFVELGAHPTLTPF